MIRLDGEHIGISIDLREGVAIDSLLNRVTNAEYLPSKGNTSANGLFAFRWRVPGKAWLRGDSRRDVVVEWQHKSADGQSLVFTAEAAQPHLRFKGTLTLRQGDTALNLNLSVANESTTRVAVEIEWPRIAGYSVANDPVRVLGALPIELGTVARLHNVSAIENGGVDRVTGYAHARDALDLAAVYESGGGGGFFTAVIGDGSSPPTFSVSDGLLTGRWTTEIGPGGVATLPTMALGVFVGDWKAAVDYYVSANRASWDFPDIPTWLRDEGAIYSFGGEGGGGIYQTQPTISLKDRIASFRELPNLLAEARQLGTNILYLFDYWEGALQGSHSPYWNKGDYIPRSDLGGGDAFKAGIAQVHAAGGRVLLYVEPFIVYRYSNLGMSIGDRWAARDEQGNLFQQYPDNYTMPSWLRPWQEKVVELAVGLVRDFGADGIFLDSYGWQWNWPSTSREDSRVHSVAEWNQGVFDLIDGVRSGIRAIKSDAVVLTESFDIHLAQHEDGSLDASFAWNSGINNARLLASPVRYAAPELNVYSAGRDLNQLNQVFAAGNSLALGPQWLPQASYVKRLVEIRQQFKDSMIHGQQAYQPVTGEDGVASYIYAGKSTRVMTLVNATDIQFTGTLRLNQDDANSAWRDIFTGAIYSAEQTSRGPTLSIRVPSEGLDVLVREASPVQ